METISDPGLPWLHELNFDRLVRLEKWVEEDQMSELGIAVEIHTQWREAMRVDGWKRGAAGNDHEHPCIVDWNDLPSCEKEQAIGYVLGFKHGRLMRPDEEPEIRPADPDEQEGIFPPIDPDGGLKPAFFYKSDPPTLQERVKAHVRNGVMMAVAHTAYKISEELRGELTIDVRKVTKPLGLHKIREGIADWLEAFGKECDKKAALYACQSTIEDAGDLAEDIAGTNGTLGHQGGIFA